MSAENVELDGVSESSSLSDPLDTTNDEGWEDVEQDEESITVVSLFDEKTFPDATGMLAYCRDSHGFDIWKLRQDFGKSSSTSSNKPGLDRANKYVLSLNRS